MIRKNIRLKKYKIAIVELETHVSLLEQWYLLFEDMTEIECHFFVSNKVLNKIKIIPNSKIHHIEDNFDVKELQDFDAILVNTMHRYFDVFNKIMNVKPTLVLVHNVNFSLFFKKLTFKLFDNSWKKIQYYSKLYLKEKISKKRKYILNAAKVGVLSKGVFNYVNANKQHSIKVELIDLTFVHETQKKISSDVVKVVVPGNISNQRKDIDLLMEVMEVIRPSIPIEFSFLGKPENDTIKEQLEHLKKRVTFPISYKSEYVPWKEYAQALQEATLVCCPVKVETHFYGVPEYYGITKVSGSENDCILYGKLGVFPETYPDFNWKTWKYKDKEELITLFNQLNWKQIHNAYQEIDTFVAQRTKNNCVMQLEKQLIDLIQNN